MTDEAEQVAKARAIAHARWQAVEGFNYAPGLSPASRRLGIALVCQMDVQTFACFPGEVRLASLLGLSKRAITDAKNELRQAGLLDWSNPGGPRHRSRYVFAWERLLDARQAADTRARHETANAKATQIREVRFPNGAQTTGFPDNPVAQNPVTDVPRDERDSHGDVTRDTEIREVLRTIREVQFQSLGKPTSPVLSHRTPPAVLAQQRAAQARGGRADDDKFDDLYARSAAARQAEAPKALEYGQAQEPRKPPAFFPKLIEAFSDEPATLNRLHQMNFSKQQMAARALAAQGIDRARAIIMGNQP